MEAPSAGASEAPRFSHERQPEEMNGPPAQQVTEGLLLHKMSLCVGSSRFNLHRPPEIRKMDAVVCRVLVEPRSRP